MINTYYKNTKKHPNITFIIYVAIWIVMQYSYSIQGLCLVFSMFKYYEIKSFSFLYIDEPVHLVFWLVLHV